MSQQSTSGNQQVLSFQTQITRNVAAQYLLFLPKDYDAQQSKRWPLILFLHGAGERGTNIWLVATHGPPKMVEQKPDFPFVVISPQCPAGQTWSNDLLISLLDRAMEQYRIDPKRVYLTGLSMGGYGTWSLGLAYPERFAAIAPVCGGGDPFPARLAHRKKQDSIRSLGVWAFHGAKDQVVQPDESKRMVAALNQIGNPAKLTIYPDASHDSWTETYHNPELYDWFLKHER